MSIFEYAELIIYKNVHPGKKNTFFINVIVEVVCYLESKLIKIELNVLENNSFFLWVRE